jgi:DNA-binding response OmpR family regulator
MANPKILFVDDDNFLRKVYEAELKEKNFDVILAQDGEEGLEKAQLEDPDLIILDMIMPKKSGFEVLTELQRNPKTRNIPVIILSNLGQEDDKKKGVDLGAVDYLIKDNITLSILVDKINQYLNSKTQSKQAKINSDKI